MAKHVRIAVPLQTMGVWYRYSPQDQVPTGDELMDIVAYASADHNQIVDWGKTSEEEAIFSR
jgi:hypothetical protein